MTVVAPERIVTNGGAPKRRSWVLVAAVIGVIVGAGLGMLVAPEAQPSGSWERIGSLSELRAEQILVVEGTGVILVNEGGRPLAMSSLDGSGQAVVYCETSGYFQDPRQGSMFDRLGRYAVGPAPRGLDRFAVLVLGDDVSVDRRQVIPGPARYQPEAAPRIGPFCGEVRLG